MPTTLFSPHPTKHTVHTCQCLRHFPTTPNYHNLHFPTPTDTLHIHYKAKLASLHSTCTAVNGWILHLIFTRAFVVSIWPFSCLCSYCLLTTWKCVPLLDHCYAQYEMTYHLHPILCTSDGVTACTPVTLFFPLGVRLCSKNKNKNKKPHPFFRAGHTYLPIQLFLVFYSLLLRMSLLSLHVACCG